MPKPKICPQCGKSFAPAHRNAAIQKHCSRQCGYESRRRTIFHRCEACGTQFSTYQARRDARFCSRACLARGVQKTCAYCGAAFRVKPSDAAVRLTCSRSCLMRLRAREKRTPHEGRPRSPETKRRVANGLRTWYGADPKKHWNYRGGKFAAPRGRDWQERRAEIRARDGYACRACGRSELEMGRQLVVHHIQRYRSFASSEAANVPSNLVGVCPSCHARIEHGTLACPTPGSRSPALPLP